MLNLFKLLKHELMLQQKYFCEAYHFWRLTVKYNASHHTDDDIYKMQYTISRETHTIEKGMSMRNPKKGFGQKKVVNLIRRLLIYSDRYLTEDRNFINYPLSTIQVYINYTKSHGVKIPEIEKKFIDLLNITGAQTVSCDAGVISLTKEDIISKCNVDFESLLFSRHSIRYFSEKPVAEELIDKALELAQRTPSACNRQGWLTHVFRAPKSLELVKWQGGCRGFENEIKCAILVTANLKAFLSYEVHQPYIDGGLYAMNLINALHSLGLGTIPLSCGFSVPHLKGLSKFGISENEVPILIVGVGNIPDNIKIAVSDRKNIDITNKKHY